MALFQERLRYEPFWMLVACVLVNRTTWRKAEACFDDLRRLWPRPIELANADQVNVALQIRKLGFWRQRSQRLIDLARAWSVKEPCTAGDVLTLPGCGRYAADSWSIFIEGRADVEPTDRALKEYLAEKS